jgi:hypothetical protein
VVYFAAVLNFLLEEIATHESSLVTQDVAGMISTKLLVGHDLFGSSDLRRVVPSVHWDK